MAADEEKYPQLTLMQAVSGESQSIGAFIEWLGENGMVVCTSKDGLRGAAFFPVLESTEKLLARYFGVDLNAAEVERRAMLAEFSARQGADTPA